MELIRLDHGWEEALKAFFASLAENQDDAFFSPHPADCETIRRIIVSKRSDEYLLLAEGGTVYGYGLLRGWDDGYVIPSLGLAIHRAIRGAGFGRALMCYLHAVARHKGAGKIRLRVHRQNTRAIDLYKRLDYELDQDGEQPDYLIGFKSLVERGAP